MKKQLVASLIIVITPLFFASCVSSLLKGNPPVFSKEIKFTDPDSPFVTTGTSVFPSWKSTHTGNVITIVSDCRENASYKLSYLHQLIESTLEDIKVVTEQTIYLQKKPALLRVIEAHLDGQPIEVQSVSFNRKSCGYVAALSGKLNNLTSDKPQFEHFINSFRFGSGLE